MSLAGNYWKISYFVDSSPLQQDSAARAAQNLNFIAGLLFFGDLGRN
jgi:hypothetical protein